MDFFGNKQKQKNIKERASSVKKNAYVDRGTSEFVNGSLKSCKNVGEKKHVLGKFSRKKNIENECLHLCNIFTGNLSSFAKVIFFKNLFFLLKYSGILQNYKRKKTKTSLKTPHNHRNIFIQLYTIEKCFKSHAKKRGKNLKERKKMQTYANLKSHRSCKNYEEKSWKLYFFFF